MVKTMKNNDKIINKSRSILKRQNLFQALLILLLLLILNIIFQLAFFRLDLTKEKRFSVTPASKEILSNLDDKVFIEVFLEDDALPAELLRYKKTVKEFLDNLKAYSNNIEIEFKNPFLVDDPEQNKEIFKQLYSKGLSPTYIGQAEGMARSEKMIFAGALIKYGDKEYPLNLLNNNVSSGNYFVGLPESELEHDFINAIMMLTSKNLQKIAFLEGHKELSEYQTYDIMSSLSKYYHIDRVNMNQVLNALDEYAVVVIAKPAAYFTEKDKFIIDQYIMQGGKIIWLVEWMKIELDSLSSKPMQMAMLNDINLDDQLFNYGVRINPDLIQDLTCLSIPVFVNTVDGKPQFEPKRWPYFPVIIPDTLLNHPLLRNLEPMRTHFVSSIDTVGENPKIKKTILLRTSKLSKSLVHPVEVNLDLMRTEPDIKTFNKPNIPIAVLLEGEFKSNFVNRLSDEFANNPNFKFLPESKDTKMIVISDGDFIRNEVKTIGGKQQALLLGQDKYYPELFTPGNTQFFVNCVNFLCADNDLISLRMREVKIRKLNEIKVKENRVIWMYINTAVPILLIVLIGLVVIIIRKVKYGKLINISKK